MVVRNGQPTTMTNKETNSIIKVMPDSIAYMLEVGWTIVDEKEEKVSKPKSKKDK